MWKANKEMSSERCEEIGAPNETAANPELQPNIYIWDWEELNVTGLPKCLIDIIAAMHSRCKDFHTCGSHLSTEDVDAELEYCQKCVRVCIMPNCCKTFTPDHEGTGYTEGMCGDCSMCRFCHQIQWDYVCPCDGCYQSGLVEEPPNTRG